MKGSVPEPSNVRRPVSPAILIEAKARLLIVVVPPEPTLPIVMLLLLSVPILIIPLLLVPVSMSMVLAPGELINVVASLNVSFLSASTLI